MKLRMIGVLAALVEVLSLNLTAGAPVFAGGGEDDSTADEVY